MREAKAELVRQGREIVQSADTGELGELCYVEMPEMGALLEVLYVTELAACGLERRQSVRPAPNRSRTYPIAGPGQGTFRNARAGERWLVVRVPLGAVRSCLGGWRLRSGASASPSPSRQSTTR
jgi:hypothetical protein